MLKPSLPDFNQTVPNLPLMPLMSLDVGFPPNNERKRKRSFSQEQLTAAESEILEELSKPRKERRRQNKRETLERKLLRLQHVCCRSKDWYIGEL